ncbi:putative ABM domain-containing protein [Seiridium unicorne]|uniref:ABM domain-containing protein n=1 Tax=Seiridium unicorne TaxID=138068 RepID=A0ABR2VCW7_9PEZI
MAQPKQLTLYFTFRIKPHLIEEFKAAHRPVWAACAAEPECLLFDVFQDPATHGKSRFVEIRNANKQWFEKEQLTKPVLRYAVGSIEAHVGEGGPARYDEDVVAGATASRNTDAEVKSR